MGLPDPSGDLFYGSEKALSPAEAAQKLASDQMKQADEQARLTREQAASQQAQMAAMQANFQTDLKGENLSNVVAGGTASLSDTLSDPAKRKKASGLSSTLGIG